MSYNLVYINVNVYYDGIDSKISDLIMQRNNVVQILLHC